MNHTAVAALIPLLMSASQTRTHPLIDYFLSTLLTEPSYPSAVSVVPREGACTSAT